MPFELTVVDTQNLSAQTVKTINNQVTSLVNRHANNSCEINRLVFESALALTAADKSAKQKAACGFFKRNFTGALNQTQNDINRELTAAQYAAQQTLVALANQNKLSFDLIAAVNNKLNAAMLDINAEINEIYDTIGEVATAIGGELKKANAGIAAVNNNLNTQMANVNAEINEIYDTIGEVATAIGDELEKTNAEIAAVNNNLNTQMANVNAEINKIITAMLTFFNSVRAELVKFQIVKQRVELLTWQNSIYYQQYKGVEYQELDDAAKIVCLVHDFYGLTKGAWNTTDLLLLKTALATVGLKPKDKINVKNFICKLSADADLSAHLFGTNAQFATENERVPFALKAANPAQLPDATASNYEFILELLCNSKQLEYAKEIHTKLLTAKEFFLACKIQEALPLLQETANAGESEARYMLATIYKKGLADNVDAPNVALLTAGTIAEENPDALKKRADDGDVFAQYEMAQYHLNVTMKYLQQSAAQNYFLAARELRWIERKETLMSDEMKALGVFCKNQGNKCYELKQYDTDRTYCLIGYMVGNADCASSLGWYCRYGYGIAKDYAKAIEYYRREYELNNSCYAAYYIAELYLEGGYGITANRSKAREWMQKAADRGNENAKKWLKDNPK